MLDQTNQAPNLNDPLVDQRDYEPFEDTFEDFLCDPLALIDEVFKNPVDVALVPVGSPSKVLEKVFDNPLFKGKSIVIEEVGETRLPSPPKQTSKRNAKIRRDERQ